MGKRTEYKRQFREPSRHTQDAYRSNYQYCVLRRQLEHQHNFVEWDWDSESENGKLCRNERNLNNSSNRERLPDENEVHVARTEKEVQTPEWSGERPEHLRSTPDRNRHISSEKNTPTPPARKSSGKKKQSGLRQKRKSRPISSPNKDAKCERSDLTPPFLAFGWADATKGVGAKQTFNVRAANEVHPAALRAFKRRELDILRNEEERQRETLKKKRTRALFNASTHVNDKEDDMWLTEYQRNFSARTPSR